MTIIINDNGQKVSFNSCYQFKSSMEVYGGELSQYA